MHIYFSFRKRREKMCVDDIIVDIKIYNLDTTLVRRNSLVNHA